MNKLAVIFITLFVLISNESISQIMPQRLSEDAFISVTTFGPWQGELYSAFGHIAFRVYDPLYDMDVAYNYGVFDFDQPNFYLNFARGRPLYKLALFDYPAYENDYIQHNRFVHEQVLNLTQAQKQEVYAYLQNNALPENQDYIYDYFYDNCSSKISEVIIDALGSNVYFDGSYITTRHSIRDLTDSYLKEQPWGDLGIDICLGLPMDNIATPKQHMFLPDYTESAFDHAYIINGNDSIPLVKEKRIIYEVQPQEPEPRLPHPLWVLSILTLVALILSVIDFKRKKLSNWFDLILFGITGLIGVLLAVLWFFTNHKAAANNFNLLWAIPSHFFIAFVLFRKKGWIKKYFLGVCVVQIIVLILWPVFPQALNYSLIPVVIALILRSTIQFYVRTFNEKLLIMKQNSLVTLNK